MSRAPDPGVFFFRVLGPVRVERGGTVLPVDSQRAKTLLAMLVVNGRRVVSVDRLVDAIWGDAPPERAVATLQVHISNLRRALGDGAALVVTEPPGYRLDLRAAGSDLSRFDDLVRHAAESRASGALDDAERLSRDAVQTWTGAALADVQSTPALEETRAWLESRRLAALEEHHELALRLGRHREAVPELERLVAQYPLRETFWELLVRACYASGSRSDALHAFRRARRVLVDELGIEPGDRLRGLEAAILAGSPPPDAEASPRQPGGHAVDLPKTTRVPGPYAGRLVLDDGTSVPVEEAVSIGRHPDCTITLADPAVSRRHAEVRPVMGGCMLVDLASANGTRVGGSYVAQRLLHHQDVIEIGSATFVFLTTPR